MGKLERFRKAFIVDKVAKLIKQQPIVAIAHCANLDQASHHFIKKELQAVHGSYACVKNTLMRRSLETCNIQELAPATRGKTIVAVGPAEASTAKALLTIGKQLPHFSVLGAVLHAGSSSQSFIQVKYMIKAVE